MNRRNSIVSWHAWPRRNDRSIVNECFFHFAKTEHYRVAAT
jgi:hypothetical protein